MNKPITAPKDNSIVIFENGLVEIFVDPISGMK